MIAAGVALLLGLGLLAFVTIKPFREEVDELYYTLYSEYLIDPTLDSLSTKYKNIAYCNSTSRFQKFDVYTPKRANKPVPAVVYIHGGGWAVGDKVNNNVNIYGTDILANDMALVSINYRLAPTYKYPTQNSDALCALNYLQLHAADFNIDPGSLGIWGDSAGGQLAAMTALSPQSKRSQTIKAVVEFYGTADLWGQINRKVNGVSKPDKRVIAYLGSSTNKTLANQASPVFANLAGAPPFLLFHGTNDTTVPFDQSLAFSQKLNDSGDEVTLRPVQHANHNFSAVSQPTAKQISNEMVQFFKSKLSR